MITHQNNYIIMVTNAPAMDQLGAASELYAAVTIVLR